VFRLYPKDRIRIIRSGAFHRFRAYQTGHLSRIVAQRNCGASAGGSIALFRRLLRDRE
jgi:hypothetical protein